MSHAADPATSADELARLARQAARDAGCDLVGIAPAVAGHGIEAFDAWLEAGYHGEMQYLADRRDVRADPNRILPGARSIVMVAVRYRDVDPAACPPGFGRVSRYAWAGDYHDILKAKLRQVRDRLTEREPSLRARPVVDSAPLLEIATAQLAGLGWIGKNTLLLNRELGSWFFLGGLLVDHELTPDVAFATDHCGTCRACLDACPTDAFPRPYELDARRCISYLTIELKSAIPPELREGMGDWLFGCDICQDVCPWNQKADRRLPVLPSGPAAGPREFAPRDGRDPVDLGFVLSLDDAAFAAWAVGTPLERPGRVGVLRNALIVAGNQRRQELRPQITALASDDSSLLADAARWALARLDGTA